MEGGSDPIKESSKASSDDHGSTDQTTNDIVSSGRFYECIFCKRGFSTAQALGGHMNIHRKDRAKMKHNPSASKLGDQDEPEGGYGYYDPYMNNNNHRSFYPPVSESLKNYSMFFDPASVRDITRKDVIEWVRPRELSLLGGNLRGEGRHGVLGHEERRERGKEGEVDLELRLGHDP